MWGLGLELPGLSLGFYDKVSVLVSFRNLSQVSVSEVAVSTTSLIISSNYCWTWRFAYFVEFKIFTITVPVCPFNWIFPYVFDF